MRIMLTAIMLLGVCVFAGAGQVASAEEAGVQEVGAEKGRVVHFPADRCMGTLYIQDEGVENIQWILSNLSDPEDKWSYFGPAQGDVEVPSGKRLKLIVAPHAWEDMSPLKNLMPDDLYSLSLGGGSTFPRIVPSSP